jgi:tetratricopeptide (TPR) repeat protein
VDWEKPNPANSVATVILRRASANALSNAAPELPESAWALWAKERPTNYWVMLRQAERLADDQKWAEARPILEKLLQLYPDSTGASSPYPILAAACRELGDTNAEHRVLTILAEKDDQATDAYARLMALASERADWTAVLTNAQRYLAVNPLVPLPYRFLAKGSEAAGDVPGAIGAYRALLQLDPPNPADVHFNLARLLHQERAPEALRHVLEALEEAPRFREALRLLRQIRQETAPASTQTATLQLP